MIMPCRTRALHYFVNKANKLISLNEDNKAHSMEKFMDGICAQENNCSYLYYFTVIMFLLWNKHGDFETFAKLWIFLAIDLIC